ncbi:glucose-methanol-choline oxidoreductase [Nocardioides sp. CF8]|uniref:GMC oxidoreductase n=1 Tax=Nocardioides sp. CF8 TaxID=110319 RepID=UPI00032E6F5D|nr:GMC family oxidoreductase [Nocardioides sp. CF8]EON24183.1 glucose-methanol-choline oxidoreductase [Nocardioides sp. CF8]
MTAAHTTPLAVTSPDEERCDSDVLVIGSGFGGSVAALRLSEKGYRVTVLEAGMRFTDDTLPRTSWDVRKFLWAPRLGLKGIQRISKVGNVVVLAGAGVGGGSLNYANTLYQPPEPFFRDSQWGHITDWKDELEPWYEQARRMLGVVQNPTVTAADEVMRSVAEDMGVGQTFSLTPVGVFFGRDDSPEPGLTVPDPYFGGAGPERTGCTQCGSCMTGCRVGAKNTLVKNYLHLAEQAGTRVLPETTVVAVRPLPDGGYAVDTVRTGSWSKRPTRTFTAEQVVLAAGTLGTQRLLHRMRDRRLLPNISPRLGVLTRTNSESLLGAQTRTVKRDYSRGVAITSSFYPDAETHVEPVRYGKGSNLMGLLQTVMTDGGGRVPRWVKALAAIVRRPDIFLRISFPHRWSERTIITLVMQTKDNSITTFTRHGRLTARQGHGEPNPTWIPVGNEATRRVAEKIHGYPGGTIGELANIPMTAHFLGGCVIGDSPETGVIDPYHRLYGHPGLHVVDGSAISANLGVNPSLTITAQAERAFSLWPNAGDPDPRPQVGAPYERVVPVTPRNPAVPKVASGALCTTRRN